LKGITVAEPNTDAKNSSKGCLWILVIFCAIIVIGFASCMSSGSDDGNSTEGSQGEAEVTCENMLRDRYGIKASSYSNEVNTSSGAFTLYGNTSDGQKFICQITGATGDGNATGTIEVSPE
jgi:hypothetical protein